MMESFREWLTNRYAPNTIRDKFIKPLKAVLKYEKERGYSIKPAYKKYSIPYIKVNHPVFYRSEVQKQIGLDLSDRPNLEDYQIVMLFGIFTGARQSLNYANEFDPESSTARPSPPGGCFRFPYVCKISIFAAGSNLKKYDNSNIKLRSKQRGNKSFGSGIAGAGSEVPGHGDRHHGQTHGGGHGDRAGH